MSETYEYRIEVGGWRGSDGFKGERRYKTEKGARKFAERIAADPEWSKYDVWLCTYVDRGLWWTGVAHERLHEGVMT